MRWNLWRQAAGVAVVLASGAAASAAVITVPLDGLRGIYSVGDWGPDRRTVSFDAGIGFERVDAIRIHLTGTMAPGLSEGEPSGHVPQEFPPAINLWIGSLGQSFSGIGSFKPTGAFDVEVLLRPVYESGWIPGEGRGQVGLALFAMSFSHEIVPPLVGIADADLIIEGQAVPEPASVSLLAVAVSAAALWRRRRRI